MLLKGSLLVSLVRLSLSGLASFWSVTNSVLAKRAVVDASTPHANLETIWLSKAANHAFESN